MLTVLSLSTANRECVRRGCFWRKLLTFLAFACDEAALPHLGELPRLIGLTRGGGPELLLALPALCFAGVCGLL